MADAGKPLPTGDQPFRDATGRFETRKATPEPGFRPAAALREVLEQGSCAADLRADVLSGVVVGIVALRLSIYRSFEKGVGEARRAFE